MAIKTYLVVVVVAMAKASISDEVQLLTRNVTTTISADDMTVDNA